MAETAGLESSLVVSMAAAELEETLPISASRSPAWQTALGRINAIAAVFINQS